MDSVTLIRSLIISIIVALLAIMIDAGSFTAPLDPGKLTLLLEFTVAIFTGILLTLLSNRSKPAIAIGEEPFEFGVVKWFNVKKGYGFITRDQGDDVFVHFRNIEGNGRRSLSDGQRVEFRVTTGEKGLQADEVSPVD